MFPDNYLLDLIRAAPVETKLKTHVTRANFQTIATAVEELKKAKLR